MERGLLLLATPHCVLKLSCASGQSRNHDLPASWDYFYFIQCRGYRVSESERREGAPGPFCHMVFGSLWHTGGGLK